MSEEESMSADEKEGETSSDELTRMLVKRSNRGRARSTNFLIVVLLVLLGVLIGVPLGRATAPADAPLGISEQDQRGGGPPRGGRPFRR